MKTNILFLFILSNLICAQEFKVPESVAFDTLSNRYFVSNYGDGNIIQIDSVGEKSYFKKGLNKSLGMIIYENILYTISNLNTIYGFNIFNGEETFKVQIPEAKFLNDITVDQSRNIYTTDSNNKAIYKINLDTKIYSLFVKTKLDNPNGIVYDKWNNRLVLCYFREESQIDQVNLSDSALSTILRPGLNNLDGISLDAYGNFYISSWGSGSFNEGFNKTGTIYKYDISFIDEPIIFSTCHHGPADIYFNIKKNELAIPLFLEDNVKFILIEPD